MFFFSSNIDVKNILSLQIYHAFIELHWGEGKKKKKKTYNLIGKYTFQKSSSLQSFKFKMLNRNFFDCIRARAVNPFPCLRQLEFS